MLEQEKDKRITFRISESDYRYLSAVAFMAGMNVSKYLRSLCDASINAAKITERQGKLSIEDVEAIQHNQL